MAFRLSIVAGKGVGREFSFAQKVVRIGRQPASDLVLYDAGVSRDHCEIIHDGDAYTLRDVGSSNGTLLNERLTTEAHLEEGDRIQVGPVVFEFKRQRGGRDKLERRISQKLFAPVGLAQQKAFEEQATTFVTPKALEVATGRRPSSPRSLGKTPSANETTDRRSESGRYRAPRRSLAKRYGGLPSSTRRALLVAAAVVVGGALLAAWLIENRAPPDRSGELFVADEGNAARLFGSGNVDVSTPDRVNFQFTYKGGRVVVEYAAGGIDSAKELMLLINGKEVGYAPASPNGWTPGLSLTVPRHLLRPGINILTFDDTLTPATNERWGVTQVQITETVLPKPDRKRAEQLYELGKAAYETRSVAPQNLWRAVEYFAQARGYLEGLAEPPPRLADIIKAEDKAKGELQSVYDSHRFDAAKASRFGDNERAAQILRDLLRYFPNPDDPRHKDAKKFLGEVASTEP